MTQFHELSYAFETAFDEDALLDVGKVEFTELVTTEYERQTGESCVYWHEENATGNYTTLPRPTNYETEGYTGSFWEWLKGLELEAFECGAESTKDVCLYIIGKLDKPKIPPDFIWVAIEEDDDGETPRGFFTDEESARAWLRDLFTQHVEWTKIPREHFVWQNQPSLHMVYDCDTRWSLSVRKVPPIFNPVN